MFVCGPYRKSECSVQNYLFIVRQLGSFPVRNARRVVQQPVQLLCAVCSPSAAVCPGRPWRARGSRRARSLRAAGPALPLPPAASRPSSSLWEFGVAAQSSAPKVKSLWACGEPAPRRFSQAEPVPSRAAACSHCGSALSAPGLTLRGVTG